MSNIDSVFRDLGARAFKLALHQSGDLARLVQIHVQKPWISNYLGPVIHPLRGNPPMWTSAHVFGDWYYPNTKWWKAHAETSHPPHGTGCDAKVHADFLTARGTNAEFLYGAALAVDGGKVAVRVLEAPDFVRECSWWKKHVR